MTDIFLIMKKDIFVLSRDFNSFPWSKAHLSSPCLGVSLCSRNAEWVTVSGLPPSITQIAPKNSVSGDKEDKGQVCLQVPHLEFLQLPLQLPPHSGHLALFLHNEHSLIS